MSRVTLLRRKRERGEVLTDEEAAVLRAYYNRYARRKLSVHLQGTREQEWRDLAAVPWDPQWECVEIWQWVPAAGNAAPAHFQTYLLDEDFAPDPVNRIFL